MLNEVIDEEPITSFTRDIIKKLEWTSRSLAFLKSNNPKYSIFN